MANLLPAPHSVLGQSLASLVSAGPEELAQLDRELASLDVSDLSRALVRLREELAREASGV